MGLVYFILTRTGLKSIKIRKNVFSYPSLTNLQYKVIHSYNYASFSQNVNKNKLKASKLQNNILSSFSAIKKTVTGVDGGIE